MIGTTQKAAMMMHVIADDRNNANGAASFLLEIGLRSFLESVS
jgi:hypothetical protein